MSEKCTSVLDLDAVESRRILIYRRSICKFSRSYSNEIWNLVFGLKHVHLPAWNTFIWSWASLNILLFSGP